MNHITTVQHRRRYLLPIQYRWYCTNCPAEGRWTGDRLDAVGHAKLHERATYPAGDAA